MVGTTTSGLHHQRTHPSAGPARTKGARAGVQEGTTRAAEFCRATSGDGGFCHRGHRLVSAPPYAITDRRETRRCLMGRFLNRRCARVERWIRFGHSTPLSAGAVAFAHRVQGRRQRLTSPWVHCFVASISTNERVSQSIGFATRLLIPAR